MWIRVKWVTNWQDNLNWGSCSSYASLIQTRLDRVDRPIQNICKIIVFTWAECFYKYKSFSTAYALFWKVVMIWKFFKLIFLKKNWCQWRETKLWKTEKGKLKQGENKRKHYSWCSIYFIIMQMQYKQSHL